MAKCRVVKGGWSWHGVMQEVGAVIEATPEWIQNRINDDGLVEWVEGEPVIAPGPGPLIETATDEPVAETAVSPRQRARRKTHGVQQP